MTPAEHSKLREPFPHSLPPFMRLATDGQALSPSILFDQLLSPLERRLRKLGIDPALHSPQDAVEMIRELPRGSEEKTYFTVALRSMCRQLLSPSSSIIFIPEGPPESPAVGPKVRGLHDEAFLLRGLYEFTSSHADRWGRFQRINTKDQLKAELRRSINPGHPSRIIHFEPASMGEGIVLVSGANFHPDLRSFQLPVHLRTDGLLLWEQRLRILDWKSSGRGDLMTDGYRVQLMFYALALATLLESGGGLFSMNALFIDGGLVRLSEGSLSRRSRLIELLYDPERLDKIPSLYAHLFEEEMEKARERVGWLFAFLHHAADPLLFSPDISCGPYVCPAYQNGIKAENLRMNSPSLYVCTECPIKGCLNRQRLSAGRLEASSVHETAELLAPTSAQAETRRGPAQSLQEDDASLDMAPRENTKRLSAMHLFLRDASSEAHLKAILQRHPDKKEIDLSEAPGRQVRLTPVQKMALLFSWERAERGALILSPTASGKFNAGLILAQEELATIAAADKVVLMLVPTRQLAGDMHRRFLRLFTRDADHSLPFSPARLFSDQILMRHGGSGGRAGRLSQAKILVTSRDWLYEFMASAPLAMKLKLLKHLTVVLLDELQTLFQEDPSGEDGFDGTGALRFSRLLDVIDSASKARGKTVRLIMMSGTLGPSWKERLMSNPRLGVIESEYKVNRIHLGTLEPGPRDMVTAIIPSLLQLDQDGRIVLSERFLPKLSSIMKEAGRRQGLPSHFAVIFVYQKALLHSIARSLEQLHKGRIRIRVFQRNMQPESQAAIERELMEADEAFQSGKAFKPMILLSTTAIAEGTSLPGLLGLHVHGKLKDGTTWPDKGTITQQTARIARIVLEDDKAEGAFVMVPVSLNISEEKGLKNGGMSDPERFVLDVCRYGEGGGFSRGLERLAARFPGSVDPNSEFVQKILIDLEHRGLVDKDGKITPEGILNLSQPWIAPVGGFKEDEDIRLAILFNLLVLPFMIQETFIDEYHGRKKFFRNPRDARHRELVEALFTREGVLSQEKLLRVLPPLLGIQWRELKGRLDLADALFKRFAGLICHNETDATKHAMFQFIMSGAIYLRLDPGGRGRSPELSSQSALYAEAHQTLEALSSRGDGEPGELWFGSALEGRLVRYMTMRTGWARERIERIISDTLHEVKEYLLPGLKEGMIRTAIDERIEAVGHEILEALWSGDYPSTPEEDLN